MNPNHGIEENDLRGWTVLNLAARHSKPQTVRRLLDQVTSSH